MRWATWPTGCRPRVRGAAIALILATAVACRADQRTSTALASNGGEREAEIFFTTGLSGYVEPCGCTSRPLGGLPRLASVWARGSRHRALVDAGQLLLPAAPPDELTRPQHLAKARLIARAFRLLDVFAANLAPPDLGEGTAFLARLQQEGAFPLVSANLRPRGDGGPEVARSRTRVVGGIRFGVTGVAIPESAARVSADVTALEIAPALRTEVEALREAGAEVVIVLAHLPEGDARALAEQVEGIDLVLRAPGAPIDGHPHAPFRAGSAIVAEAGQQGQYLGRARFVLGATRAEGPLALDDAGARRQADRARLERRIAALDVEIARLSVNPSAAQEAQARRAVREDLARRLDEPQPPAASLEGPRVEVTVVPLDSSMPEDDAMSRLLAAYYQALREMNLERADPEACTPASEAAPRYVGNARCASCHVEAHEFWKSTAHARAWATLERAAKHYDLTCVGCHTVGFRQPGGFCRLSDSAAYRDVGCESCHGPGSAHAEAPSRDNVDRGAAASRCRESCHVPEHSDAFEYESYVRRITGPGHRLGGDPE